MGTPDVLLGQGRGQDDLAEILFVALDVLANGLIEPLHVPGVHDDTGCQNGLISFGRLGLWIDHQEVDDEFLFTMGNESEIGVVASSGFGICCNLHLSFWQWIFTSIGFVGMVVLQGCMGNGERQRFALLMRSCRESPGRFPRQGYLGQEGVAILRAACRNCFSNS